MFAARYFPKTMFAGSYFPPTTTFTPVEPSALPPLVGFVLNMGTMMGRR